MISRSPPQVGCSVFLQIALVLSGLPPGFAFLEGNDFSEITISAGVKGSVSSNRIVGNCPT
jgi:hypothetical protein